MQRDVMVNNGTRKVNGYLYNMTESNAITDYWGTGNFLALKFGGVDITGDYTIKVGLDPSEGSGLVELDSDMNGVFKITNKGAQKLVIQALEGSDVVSEVRYDLSKLHVDVNSGND